MRIPLILICCIIAFFIIKEKQKKRAEWLLIGLLFTLLDITILPSPPISSHKLYLIAFYISLFKHNEFKTEFRNYPFKTITIILCILSFCISFADTRLNFTSQIQRGFTNILELSSLFIGYSCIKEIKDFTSIYKKLYNYLVIICIFGIFTWIIKGNPYYDFITSIFSSEGIGIWSEVQDRGYRVCSTFSNPIVYGFILSLYTLIFWELKEIKLQKISLIIGLLFILNILFSNSRTNLVSFVIAICIYFILKFGLSKKLFIYGITIISLIALSYNFIEPIKNIFDSVIDIFLTGGKNTSGSTVELKEQQQKFAYLFFLQSPWWGNGYNYFNEVIQMGKINFYNGELAGLEGYGYRLLVEQGIFMIIANIIYILQITKYLLKRINVPLSKVSLAIFIAFVFFIMVAGTYGGVMYYTFIILGMNIKFIKLFKYKYISHEKNTFCYL
mgnify:CR=1 FL=1